nr:MAG TPA: hypothetical protein [Caudoviricetes sp.]
MPITAGAMCKNRFTACLGRRPSDRANASHLLRVFLQRPTRRVGRDPLFIGSVRVIFLSALSTLSAFARYGKRP